MGNQGKAQYGQFNEKSERKQSVIVGEVLTNFGRPACVPSRFPLKRGPFRLQDEYRARG